MQKIQNNLAYLDSITNAVLCVYDIRDNVVYTHSIGSYNRKGYSISLNYIDAVERFTFIGKYKLRYTGSGHYDDMWMIVIE